MARERNITEAGGAEKINYNKKYSLDFKIPMLSLDGTKDNNITLNKVVSRYLGGNTDGDAYKFSDWAMAVYQGEILTLDKADFVALKEYLKSIKAEAMVRRQILDVIDEVDK